MERGKTEREIAGEGVEADEKRKRDRKNNKETGRGRERGREEAQKISGSRREKKMIGK